MEFWFWRSLLMKNLHSIEALSAMCEHVVLFLINIVNHCDIHKYRRRKYISTGTYENLSSRHCANAKHFFFAYPPSSVFSRFCWLPRKSSSSFELGTAFRNKVHFRTSDEGLLSCRGKNVSKAFNVSKKKYFLDKNFTTLR